MKKIYIFTDKTNGETFTVICEPYEVHSIDRTNKELEKWCEGRIIIRNEETIK